MGIGKKMCTYKLQCQRQLWSVLVKMRGTQSGQSLPEFWLAEGRLCKHSQTLWLGSIVHRACCFCLLVLIGKILNGKQHKTALLGVITVLFLHYTVKAILENIPIHALVLLLMDHSADRLLSYRM